MISRGDVRGRSGAGGFYRHYRGRYDLPGGAVLYVTTGSGTWGPAMRLLARPEVAMFTLTGGSE